MIWRRGVPRPVNVEDGNAQVISDAFSVEATLDYWCERETRYWSSIYRGSRDFTDEFARLNQVYPTIFIVTVAAGTVTVRPKRDIVANDGTILGEDQPAHRMRLYLAFIQQAVREYAPDLETVFALDVHDESVWGSNAPIFSFQKMAASRNILVPDIDFMTFSWYEQTYAEPEIAEKRPAAAFVGASTGGGILSQKDVTTDRSHRLRLARNLFGHDHILFRIGSAVQCDNPETATLLEAKRYFLRGLSWEDQLQYGFVISVDGNGATCSRVVNTLRSRSVLIKMGSPNLLYYFEGMKPWVHYIPAETVADLDRVMLDHLRGEIDVVGLITRANRFFADFLSREPVHRYMAKLLCVYQRDVAARRGDEPTVVPGLLSSVLAHVAGIDDVVTREGQWLQTGLHRLVEGIELRGAPGIAETAVRYRCLWPDGRWSEWSTLGGYCGTRGEGRPICGAEIVLDEEYARRWNLRCECLFQGGHRRVVAGSELQAISSDGAALVDIRLMSRPLVSGV